MERNRTLPSPLSVRFLTNDALLNEMFFYATQGLFSALCASAYLPTAIDREAHRTHVLCVISCNLEGATRAYPVQAMYAKGV